MQTTKISVALICGGQSPEHEISLLSAQNVLNAIDFNEFDCHVIYINKSGTWHLVDQKHHQSLNKLMHQKLPEIRLIFGSKEKQYFCDENNHLLPPIHIAFPVLHGQLGEDGTIQGLFKMLNLPFVGNDVLSSAICMDKDVTKRLLQLAGIVIPKFLVFSSHEKEKLDFENISRQLNLPFFLKPANTGSSIGVKKIKQQSDFDAAINQLFYYDDKIIAEQYIAGREIELGVLGNNDHPIASIPGEIICHHEFYSYEAKYLDEKGADVIVPADLSQTEIKAFQDIAIKAFNTLCCTGIARVDFFYSQPEKKIYLNEINTLPGFTNISMYPKCFQSSQISYAELIKKLLVLGLEKQRMYGI
jgi:D-alanine-D-alanine ligase